MKNFIFVFFGAGVGGMLRYAISSAIKWNGISFPWATWLANLIGCFVMGLAIAYCAKNQIFANQYKLIITTGLCGGFTTFSAFSSESMLLINQGNVTLALAYISSSLLLGLAMVWVGSNIDIA
jgi:fluoride exporter